MKKYFLLILINVSAGGISAQDYNVIIFNQAQYFATNTQYIDYYNPSWSPIKVMYFDSTASSGSDTNFFSFHTWRDTADSGTGFDCIETDGPAWTGNHVHKINNGMTLFFNIDSDTIFIKTNAALNDSWRFMNLINSGYVMANLDSIVWTQQAGISDSIKCFSLQAFDSSGTLIPAHPINNTVLSLSKAHGFFRAIDFYDLPNTVEVLNRVDSVPMPTWAQVYDFDAGDEFEYFALCNWILNPMPNSWAYVKIVSKFYSTNSDTVYYHRHFVHGAYVLPLQPPYEYDFFGASGDDTIFFPVDTSPIFSTFPEENLFNSDSTSLMNYLVRRDSGLFNNHPEYSQIEGFLGYLSGDSCIGINHFEAVHNLTAYASGLGITHIFKNDFSSSGFNTDYSLVWYHKSSETYGHYYDLTAGIENISFPGLLIYPNPVRTKLHVELMWEKNVKIKISDLTGRTLWNDDIHTTCDINVENFPAGIYLLELTDESISIVRKIIISN